MKICAKDFYETKNNQKKHLSVYNRMNSYHAFWNDKSGVGIRNSSLDPYSNDTKERLSELKRRSSKQEFLIQTINELTEKLEQERHEKDKLRKR